MRGSARVLPTCGAVARLGERVNGIQEVEGSAPFGSTPAIPFQTRSPVKSARQGSEAEGPGQISAATDRSIPARLASVARSEEHTSELQSPDHLVCRPLLEKKKEEAGGKSETYLIV